MRWNRSDREVLGVGGFVFGLVALVTAFAALVTAAYRVVQTVILNARSGTQRSITHINIRPSTMPPRKLDGGGRPVPDGQETPLPRSAASAHPQCAK